MDTIQLNPKTCKICLNMIVKNEAKVIRRLLETVYRLIDKYCICDTGSTDNTMDIIREFFLEKGIDGEIFQEPFRDFGYNRSYSLKKCDHSKFADIDYILLLDADMYLSGPALDDPDEFKRTLGAHDVYYLLQGSDRFYYKNVRIVRPRKGYYYWGVTHEYVKTTENTTYGTIEKNQLFIQDIGDGGSKTDKFERDIKLLNRGLEEIPNNDRYTFYLANSYRGAGQHEKAIEYYKRRIAIGGWQEEVWNSYLSAGHSYKDLGRIEEAVVTWLEGYNYWDGRVENLYEIIHHYRVVGKQRLAYMLYTVAEKIVKQKTTWDNLFLHKDVYDYLLDYEMTILGYYHNDAGYDLKRLCMRVISDRACPAHITNNIFSNYKFYTEAISSWQTYVNTNISANADGVGGALVGIGRQYGLESRGFVSSTPSMTLYDNTLVVNVRYVNYSIDSAGNYVNGEHITTVNVVATFDISAPKWVKQLEFVLGYDESKDGRYVGLEDVKLTCLNPGCGWTVLYNANRGVGDIMAVEHGIVHLDRKCVEGDLVKIPNQGNLEKNWVILPRFGADGEIMMVYGWSPLKIGGVALEGGVLNITHTYDTPGFFRGIRGSTNGIIVEDEIWMLCHYVSYEDRRYYYHMMVVLDLETYRLKRHTRLFTFDKEKVEYTTGFVYLKKTREFLIGYSVMDKETKYMVVDKSRMDSYMIPVA